MNDLATGNHTINGNGEPTGKPQDRRTDVRELGRKNSDTGNVPKHNGDPRMDDRQSVSAKEAGRLNSNAGCVRKLNWDIRMDDRQSESAREAGRRNRALPRKPLLITLTALMFLSAGAVLAEPLRTVTATITKISDGDTVQAITPEGTKLKVRLYGIDAPETAKGNKPGEPFGDASRDYLTSLVTQKSVRVEIRDIDRYRRMVAVLWLGERNVNQEMISAGMAEAYREYLKPPYRAPFLQAEQAAKAQGKGIWSQGSSYERPSQFRRKMGG